jgi:hypothetical protein
MQIKQDEYHSISRHLLVRLAPLQCCLGFMVIFHHSRAVRMTIFWSHCLSWNPIQIIQYISKKLCFSIQIGSKHTFCFMYPILCNTYNLLAGFNYICCCVQYVGITILNLILYGTQVVFLDNAFCSMFRFVLLYILVRKYNFCLRW